MDNYSGSIIHGIYFQYQLMDVMDNIGIEHCIYSGFTH